MKALAIVAMLLMSPMTWADTDDLAGTYKCVSHKNFEFANLEVTEEQDGALKWLLNGTELTNFELAGQFDDWGGLTIWPMDDKTGEDTDELYCKKQ